MRALWYAQYADRQKQINRRVRIIMKFRLFLLQTHKIDCKCNKNRRILFVLLCFENYCISFENRVIDSIIRATQLFSLYFNYFRQNTWQYIYIYNRLYKITVFRRISYIFYFMEVTMRIILDTDKKTITVPWNYQQKLDEINRVIMEVCNDESKKKTFTGYINEMWKECIEHSDSCVKTGEKPFRKSDKK